MDGETLLSHEKRLAEELKKKPATGYSDELLRDHIRKLRAVETSNQWRYRVVA